MSNFTITNFFGKFGENLFSNILGNTNVLAALFFIALFIGTFAIFKGLLSFFFRSTNQFKNKEISVIALMLSFMGSSGIAFMFRDDPEVFINFFGGISGLLIIIFFAIIIMKFFIELGKTSTGKVFPLFWYSFGTLIISGMILGYTSYVLTRLLDTDFDRLFVFLNNLIYPIFEISLIAVIILGLILLSGLFGITKAGSDDLRKGKSKGEKELEHLKKTLDSVHKEVEKLDQYFAASNSFLNSKDIRGNRR